jgi:valyl-tRNA synthetase
MPAYGTDALRFTLAALTAQGRDIKLSLDRVEGNRSFANKIWNASRFVLMNLGPSEEVVQTLEKQLTLLPLALADRWILARLHKVALQANESLEAYKFNEAASILYQFAWGEFCDWYIELSKGALSGQNQEAKAKTRAVLVHVLDQLLKLLHPFMPFLTEEIWQRIPRRSCEPASIMVATYPQGRDSFGDDESEQEMSVVIQAIDGVRNIRGECNIAPSKKVAAVVQAEEGIRLILERNRDCLEPLAGLCSLALNASGPKPKLAATFVGKYMEIFVPLEGLVDLAEENKRLQKELGKVDADLELLKKKHSNSNFVLRAPREVIEKDRLRIGELEQKRLKLEQGIARLKGGSTNEHRQC